MPGAGKIVIDGVINMAGNVRGVNIYLVRNQHCGIVHHIAQITLFFYRLMPAEGFGNRKFFGGGCRTRVLVVVYHKLPRNKAKQQYACANDMIFIPFQTFYGSSLKIEQR